MNSIPHRHTTFVPELAVPKDSPNNVFEDVVTDLYGRGLSAQEIALRIRQLYNHSISAAAIANITAVIQAYAAGWQTRALSRVYFVLFIERMSFKVEADGSLSDKVIWVASGSDSHGQLEILGIWQAENENHGFWMGIFEDLRSRGVADIPITSTAGCEIEKPFFDVFRYAPIQITVVQQLRAAAAYFQGQNKRRLVSELKSVYMAENIEIAWRALNTLRENCKQTYGYVLNAWQRNWHSLGPFFSLGPHTRHVIYSSSPAAELYKKISFFTGPTGTFLNTSALMKATFLALREISQKKRAPIRNWSTVLNELNNISGHILGGLPL